MKDQQVCTNPNTDLVNLSADCGESQSPLSGLELKPNPQALHTLQILLLFQKGGEKKKKAFEL